jgi:hypothetical protein
VEEIRVSAAANSCGVLSRNFEVFEACGDVLRRQIWRWIKGSAGRREEAGPAPLQFAELCNEPTGARNFAKVVSLTIVNFIALEMTYMSSIAGKQTIRLAVGKSLATTRPKPIDIR